MQEFSATKEGKELLARPITSANLQPSGNKTQVIVFTRNYLSLAQNIPFSNIMHKLYKLNFIFM